MNEQWFWEQCGLRVSDANYILEPDGSKDGKIYYYETNIKARIDLNNLFKYAVPLLERKLGYKEAYMLLIRWITEVVGGEDPADSLFRAIYEAFGGK